MIRGNWQGGFVFCCHGVRFGVRTTDREVLVRMLRGLPPGWRFASGEAVEHLYSVTAGRDGERYHRLNVGIVRLGRSLQFDDLVSAFEADLQLRVAEFARRRVFVHAGVVGWNGGAIVLPGHSFTGKSTLVEALVRAGATYYSDEYAVFDGQGRVHPYARPIVQRLGPNGGSRQVVVEEIGGQVGGAPIEVKRVIFTQYRAGARWRPRECSPGRGTLGLLAHTIPARRKPAESLSVLSAALGGAIVLKGARGDAEASAKSILNLS
jgi:hypothetical protein